MSGLGDIPGTVENPVMGRPYVILQLNKARFRVSVLAHCKSKAEAQGMVDDYTTEPAKIEYMIVSSANLKGQLAQQRERMAKRMEKKLGI